MSVSRPVILIAAANDRSATGGYLAALSNELRGVREALEAGHRSGRWEVDSRPNVTVPELLSLLRDPAYAARVAMIHYAGHASPGALFLESDSAAPQAAHAGGLAALLGSLPALRLVFLNGCETRDQAAAVLAAGVSAVIATDVRISDKVATQFAIDVYGALVEGRTVDAAFRFAEGAAHTRVGDQPRAAYRDFGIDAIEDEAVDWPWRLHCAARNVERWTLTDLLGSPAVATKLRTGRLPERPYRHLLPFTRDDAAVFFGRTRDLRQLLDAIIDPDGAPLVLLFGGAGTGKSSLLDAGLASQLFDRTAARYARRDAQFGLGGTLRSMLGVDPSADSAAVESAWTALETAGHTLVLLLDQVEESITRSTGDPHEELRAFAEDLAVLLAERDPGMPPRRVVLGFRKEWLAEVQAALRGLWSTSHFLDRLDEAAVIEAVRGPADVPRLARQYHLEIEDGLAEAIARDMLADPHAPVAPTLQVLLARMWDSAPVRDGVRRVFDRELYERLRREGLLLGDFLDQQLAVLARTHAPAVGSGLALDVLHAHTTAHATAEGRTAEDMTARYAGAGESLKSLVQQLIDLYLLTTSTSSDADTSGRPTPPMTRLVHDTLAPLVRERFDRSDRPAQRARRLLELRVRDWRERGTPISLEDLAVIEAGIGAMRALDVDEQALLESGRDSRRIANVARRAANLPDHLRAAELIVTLRGAPRPPGGAAVAATIAAQPLPIFEAECQWRTTLALAPNGRRVLMSDDDSLRVISTDDAHEPTHIKHDARPVSACFSVDRTLALVCHDRTVRMWRLDGSAEPLVMSHEDDVWDAVLDPQNQRVAVLGAGQIYLWNAQTADAPRVLQHELPVRMRPLFSPDGQWLLTVTESAKEAADRGYAVEPGDYEYLYLWRMSDLDHPRRLTTATVSFTAFSPDSARFLTMSNTLTLRACDDDAEIELATPDGFHTAVFAPDSSRIAMTGGGEDVTVHDLNGSAAPVRLRNRERVQGLGFSPSGVHIAAVMSSGVMIWPVDGADPFGDAYPLLLSHPGATGVEFSSDGTFIMTARDSSDKSGVRLWRNQPAPEPVTLRTSSFGNLSVFAGLSPDGSRVVSADGGAVRIWSAVDGRVITELPGGPDIWVDFTTDAHIVTASKERGLCIWNADGSGEPVVLLAGTRVASVDEESRRILAVADKTIFVWPGDAAGDPIRLEHPARVISAEFGMHGAGVVTVTDDEVCIWTLDGQPPRVVIAHAASFARLSADGTRVVTLSGDGHARIWRADGTGEPLVLPHDERPWDADFSPDGSFVVTAAGRAGHVWATDGRGELRVLEHDSQVGSARYSRDGRRILIAPAVGWGACSVHVWPADGAGGPVALVHPNGTTLARFSRDGTRVVTGCTDGTRLWRVGWDLLLEHLDDRVRAVVRPNR